MASSERPRFLVDHFVELLNNGHNDRLTRQASMELLQKINLPPNDQKDLINGVELGWRREGELEVSQLDAAPKPQIPQKKAD